MSRKYPLQVVNYRPPGRGQQTRRAWINLAVIPSPRDWLEQRLGPLALFEMVRDPLRAEAPRPAATLPTTLIQPPRVRQRQPPAPLLEQPHCGDLDPGMLAPRGMITPPPSGVWRTATGLRIEEALSARIIGPDEIVVSRHPEILIFENAAGHRVPVAVEWLVPRASLIPDTLPWPDDPWMTQELVAQVTSTAVRYLDAQRIRERDQ